jgi:hypothetical protein
MRRPTHARRPPPATDAPEQLTRALDASAEDIRTGRVEDSRKFLRSARAKLEAYLANQDTPNPSGPKS